MNTQAQFSLKTFNSFNIQAITAKMYLPSSINELIEISNKHLTNFYVLGEGSNTLFCEQQAPTIIKPSFKGIKINENKDNFHVSVACAENWHDFVQLCLNKGIYGLENLALIPGSVGAAPVQNIGAYGVEVADFIDSVSWFDFNKQHIVNYSNAQCQFAYRESIFKQQLNGLGVITHVHFKFPKNWQPTTSYHGLNNLVAPISAQAIMLKVIQLRQEKLPDPKMLANAGSFFKNPIVSTDCCKDLQQQYPEVPYYRQSNGDVKLAAGWLIEQAGLKGFRDNGAGVHEKQALVLVNYANATGQDIVNLAQYVQEKVLTMFGIKLVPEVRFITHCGEIEHISTGN